MGPGVSGGRIGICGDGGGGAAAGLGRDKGPAAGRTSPADPRQARASGSDQHYYHLRVAAAGSSDHNPYVEFEGGWHLEFNKHWTVELKGFSHRSQMWNAEGAWVSFGYRF